MVKIKISSFVLVGAYALLLTGCIGEYTGSNTITDKYNLASIKKYDKPEKLEVVKPINWQKYRIKYGIILSRGRKLWMPIPREWDGIGMRNIKIIDISPKPKDIFEDEHGNLISFWRIPPSRRKYSITLEIWVAPIKYKIQPYSIGSYDQQSYEYKRYTKPSKRIQSNNETIRRLAKKIIGNEKSPLNQAVLLHRWVATNIRGGGVLDALDTLESRAAGCGGHSQLLIALCRSIGIPARQVTGLHTAYEGKFSTGYSKSGTVHGHIWSEYYIPDYGWIQCDTSAGNKNSIGINEPRIVLSKGEDIELGHGFIDETIPWFHAPHTDRITGSTPRTQTHGEGLFLIVEEIA